MTVETFQGNYPEMVTVVKKTHSLRHNFDLILVGFVDAKAFKQKIWQALSVLTETAQLKNCSERTEKPLHCVWICQWNGAENCYGYEWTEGEYLVSHAGRLWWCLPISFYLGKMT